MRKVTKGQRYVEYGFDKKPFTVTKVSGPHVMTTRDTTIKTSRFLTSKYYKLLNK
jgi:hypothetical protein